MDRRNRRNKAIARVLAVIIVIALVFSCMGYLFYAFAADEDDLLADARLKQLPDLLIMIKEQYRDEKTLLELVNAAYDGVFDSLDQWSEYYSSLDEEKAFENAVNPGYSGIGVTFEQVADGVRVAEVNPFGPAYNAGVTVGGFVRKINGSDVSALPATEIAQMARGDAGTMVTIVLSYGGEEKIFSITRRLIPDTTVYSAMLDGQIGYLRLLQISEMTDSEFLLAHTELINQSAQGLIVDMRGCPGGYMYNAAVIAEELMPAGPIASYVRQGKTVQTVKGEGSSLKLLPTVLLIDEDTASACEMIAGALQDNEAATIVGTVSYGKGVAQGLVELGNEDAIRLSTVYFVTPDGHYIEEKGIRPDHIVYNGYGYSEAQIKTLTKDVIAMDEGIKYSAGQSGRNVLAAQQRLKILGYDVDATGRMDERTVEVIKAVQKAGGGSPYGGLDLGTMAMIEARYKALCTPEAGDLQLAKAIEVLSK